MLLTDSTALVANVDLQKSGETGLSTVDTPLPPIFYVIAGAGPAAVINHSTLVHSEFGKDRLANSPAGKLPIIHIGFSNPWGRYMRHGMGQPPYLLNLPGFKSANLIDDKAGTVDGGLDSRVFASSIDNQFQSLREREIARWRDEPTAQLVKLQWPWNQGWIAMIQTRAKEAFQGNLANEIGGLDVASKIAAIAGEDYPQFPDLKMAPYRVLVVRKVAAAWKAEWIYAQFIDFCTGTGRPRVIIKPAQTDEHKKALTPPWLDPASWITELGNRRILSGMDAICDDATWANGERICVPKGGGIALNAAEKAVHNRCQLDWFDDKPLLPTFANPRNYTFLKHWSEERPRGVGEDEPRHPKLTEPDLVPSYAAGRLGKNAEVSTAKLVLGGTKVEVTLAAKEDKDLIRSSSRLEARLADGCWQATGAIGDPPSKNYDRLALAQGLDAAGTGQPKWLAGGFGVTNEIRDPDDRRMLALGTADQTIRLLGAAAQVYPGFTLLDYRPEDDSGSPMTGMWSFRATLPVSTVPDGFILSGVNIACANQFFTKARPNRNLNTLTTAQINAALFAAGSTDGRELSEIIAADRNVSNGYENGADLIAKLNKNALQKVTDAKGIGEEAYIKQRVDPVRRQIADEKAAELKRIDEAVVAVAVADPLRGTLLEQYALRRQNAIKEYDQKSEDRTGLATTKARMEFEGLEPRAKRIAQLVEANREILRTKLYFSYDPVDD